MTPYEKTSQLSQNKLTQAFLRLNKLSKSKGPLLQFYIDVRNHIRIELLLMLEKYIAAMDINIVNTPDDVSIEPG